MRSYDSAGANPIFDTTEFTGLSLVVAAVIILILTSPVVTTSFLKIEFTTTTTRSCFDISRHPMFFPNADYVVYFSLHFIFFITKHPSNFLNFDQML
jgi:hypothetical protein